MNTSHNDVAHTAHPAERHDGSSVTDEVFRGAHRPFVNVGVTRPARRNAMLAAGLGVVVAAAVSACSSGSSSGAKVSAVTTASSAAATTGDSSIQSTASAVGTASSSQAKSTNPCDLVKAADVTKVMGGAVGASQFNDAGISALCSYPSANQTDDDREFNVGITVVKDTQSKSDFEDFPGVTMSHVSGVGDDALWDASKSTLYVLKGGKVIEVGIGGPSDALTARAKRLAAQLAQIAVARL